MTNQPSGIKAVDSLSANEFWVELDGEAVSGVFSVSGLCTRFVDAATGDVIHPPLIITKMVQQDPSLPFNTWTRATLTAPHSRATRDVAVVAADEGVETRRWVYKDAWISAIMFSDFDTARQELVAEQVTIQHSGVQEIWP